MRLPELLRGPGPAWPAPVDAALEAWASLPARARALLGGAAAVVVVTAASGGLLQGPWGAPVTVLVTRDVLAPGAVVTPAQVVVTERPDDVLPSGALREGELPQGAVATGHVPQGAVLTAGQVTPGGPAAAIAEGLALVPVPVEQLPSLPPDTHLRLVAAGTDGSAVTVAARARLAHDDGTHRWLEVAVDDVAGVAAAVARGGLSVGVVP